MRRTLLLRQKMRLIWTFDHQHSPANCEAYRQWTSSAMIIFRCQSKLLLSQWPFQDPIDWRYLPYVRPIFQALISGNIPTKYGQKYGTKLVPPGTFTYLHVLDPEDPYWFLIMSSWAKRLNLASSPIIESSPWSTAKPRLDLRQRTPEMLAALGNYGNISNHWRFS